MTFLERMCLDRSIIADDQYRGGGNDCSRQNNVHRRRLDCWVRVRRQPRR